MDIGCPNCAATYRVPDTLLASGKPLRCVACGHEWIPVPPPAEPVFASQTEPVLHSEAEPVPDSWAQPAVADSIVFGASARPDVVTMPPALPGMQRQGADAAGPIALRKPAQSQAVPPPLQRRGPPHHAAARAPGPQAPPRRGNFLPAAWLASVLVVVLLLLGLVLYRTQIASAWPPFARVAGLIGG